MQELFGLFTQYGTVATLASVLVFLSFGFIGVPLWLWTLAVAVALFGFGASTPVWAVAGLVAVVLNLRPLRRVLLSLPILTTMRKLKLIPSISETERVALEAGVVWVEGDLFSGKPNFNQLVKEPYPELTDEEKAFLDGPVEKVCAMSDEWKSWQERKIDDEIWAYMRKEKFLGMIIPKKYGGLEFSAAAHSAVIKKLASKTAAGTIMTMVPNSLGPAELLTHYGTEEQRQRWLPDLAIGKEVPCFALTEPTAGSDAGSLTSYGTLFKNDKGELCIRLNWNKRWITLAGIATVVGLAFRLYDPENLLGKGEDLGISCGLIPANTPGVVLGRRHDPLGVPFHNCPTQGHDVEVNAEQCIIGGVEQAGQGWAMLMESLGAGRGISLPAQSGGSATTMCRIVTDQSIVRKQFGVEIGKFEGVGEKLARMYGLNYAIEAFSQTTLGALDKEVKPPVVTAIAKYNSTELARVMLHDAMDIMGGAGLSRGPRNMMTYFYQSAPIGITVEGANILTRTLMIFGQGALRAHPYAYQIVKSAEGNDLKAFDKAFFGHMGHVLNVMVRSFLLSITRGRLASRGPGGPVGRYYQTLSWTSASFAALSEFAMATLGGALKQKEKVTGRFADILSWMFIGYSVLRRWEAEGRREEDLPLVHYAMSYGFTEIQRAFEGLFANLQVPGLTWLFRATIGWWASANRIGHLPYDEVGNEFVKKFLTQPEFFDFHTRGIFVSKDENDPLGRLEHAVNLIRQAQPLEKKVKKAVRKKKLEKKKIVLLLDDALEKKIITREEYEILVASEKARWEAVQVDDFSDEEYYSSSVSSGLSGLNNMAVYGENTSPVVKAYAPSKGKNTASSTKTSHSVDSDEEVPQAKLQHAQS